MKLPTHIAVPTIHTRSIILFDGPDNQCSESGPNPLLRDSVYFFRRIGSGRIFMRHASNMNENVCDAFSDQTSDC